MDKCIQGVVVLNSKTDTRVGTTWFVKWITDWLMDRWILDISINIVYLVPLTHTVGLIQISLTKLLSFSPYTDKFSLTKWLTDWQSKQEQHPCPLALENYTKIGPAVIVCG